MIKSVHANNASVPFIMVRNLQDKSEIDVNKISKILKHYSTDSHVFLLKKFVVRTLSRMSL